MLVRENVKGLQPYSSARDEFKDARRDDLIFLDANENPFENGINRYPDPQQHLLKSKLAEIKQVEVAQILLGNGSDEVLDLLFRAFCEPHIDNIITLPPTYGMYSVLAGINAIANTTVLLNEDLEPSVDQILEAVDKHTKLLFLCSPNNPTGNSFTKTAILRILQNFQGLVVIDEAYIDFSENESWVKHLTDYPNLVVTQTLSKAYGMAGIRLGICMASREIITILNKIKPPYNVNELSQLRAMQQISNKEIMANEVAQIISERRRLLSELESLEFVQQIYKTDANFVLVKVDDANVRYQQLIDKGIVVRNRSTQPRCENTLRFTIGTPAENNKLISTLKALD